MVFESVLSSLLNKYLSEYVENLDPKQLNVGIWGGDVKLNNLVIKQSALDSLDLPIQCVYGKIGKLFLKIPWKNLYNNFIVICIEDIYLIASPNTQVKYDPVKEANRDLEHKLNKIQKIEEAKKKELEAKNVKQNFTFAEKLVTQIIKNIQLNIKNIHIRYEDKVTNINRPFALGITLADLEVVSTDSKWNKAITYENITKNFKLLKLDGLSIYWNSDSIIYSDNSVDYMVQKMNSDIASKNYKPPQYNYILGPINAVSRIRLNQKPEMDSPPFIIPKIDLNVDMEKLFVGITKSQYQDIVALTSSFDIMVKGIPFRKFRPHVPTYKDYYKEWWIFAYNCILEDIKRKKRNWDWDHMMNHRSICKNYAELYQKKLKNQAGNNELSELCECEKTLDLFNLVLIRQRVELETERLEKLEDKPRSSIFNWLWSSKSQEQVDEDSNLAILKQFQTAMSAEEKKRLYKALDYQENALPTQYPETYEDISCTFSLNTLQVKLIDDVKEVTFSELNQVTCIITTRVAASALSVQLKFDELKTFGFLQDNNYIPQLIMSDIYDRKQNCLLELLFEINPLDKSCDQRLHLKGQPLRIVYDEETIKRAIDIFNIPTTTSLNQLQAAAGSGLSNFKELSATGIQHAIENHARLDFNISLCAPYILVPYGGKYTENEDIIVLHLGNIKICSVDRRKSELDVRKMHAKGIKGDKILIEMFRQSYDQFILELTDVQLMMAKNGEDWYKCIKESQITDMHILTPVSLTMKYYKCLFSDDPRLPFNKITGEVPSVNINLSNARLLLALKLISSITLPGGNIEQETTLKRTMNKSSSMMLKYWETDIAPKSVPHPSEKKKDGSFVQFTKIDVKFVMSEFTLNLYHQMDVTSELKNFLFFQIKSLNFDLLQQTFNTIATIRLDSVNLQQYRSTGSVDIIKSISIADNDENQYLFKMKFIQVNKTSPEFHNIYKSCESCFELDFATLSINLHQEGLLEIIRVSTELQNEIEKISVENKLDRIATTHRHLSPIREAVSFMPVTKKTSKKDRKISFLIETIKFKLISNIDTISIQFSTDSCDISLCSICGIKSEIIMKESYTQINATLLEINVNDLNPKSIHKKILTVTEDKTIVARIIIYNEMVKTNSKQDDISIFVSMGGLRIIFLNWFIMRMLDFLNNFQTAQNKIIEASQAAAETAKQNVQNVYEKATKVSLDIDLKAPDIIIPVNSTSLDAILIDLGHILIKNTFADLNYGTVDDEIAIIDDLKMNLSDLKILRIYLDRDIGSQNDCILLEPTTFNVLIKRNLSSSYYTAIPDIDIFGKINTITIQITQGDYQAILSTLESNLSEGQNIKHIPHKQSQQSTNSERYIHSNVESGIYNESFNMYQKEVESRVNTFVRFTFCMEKLNIILYHGGNKTLNQNDPARLSLLNNKESLGRFSLEGLSVKGRILSDNSIVTSVLLLNCFLDDTRRGREDKLTRLIERSQETIQETANVSRNSTDSTVKSMIDFTFQMKNNDTFIDIRVYSFKLILSMDYILKINEFFNKSNEKNETIVPVVPKSSMTSIKKTKNYGHPPSQNQMTLNIKIEKPDIILVEHMNHINTNALILNCEVIIKLRTIDVHQVINGTVKDLQLFIRYYNPETRTETRSNVLYPVTISLAGSTPEDKGLHVDLVVTDVKLSVSPDTIELLNRIFVTLTKIEPTTEDTIAEVQDYSTIWEPKPFSDDDFWFLGTETAEEADELLISKNTSIDDNKDELCLIALPLLTITLEAGVGNKTLPMLIFESSLKGNIRNWSSRLSIDASLTLEMGYYNSRLALWEPLIEPVERKDNKLEFVPWELRLEVSMNEQDEFLTSPITDVQSEGNETVVQQNPVMSIDITSDSILQLTLTKTCLEVLNNLGKAFALAMEIKEVKQPQSNSLFKFRNETGAKVVIKLDDSSFKISNNNEIVDVILEDSTEVSLELKLNENATETFRLRNELISQKNMVNNRFLCVEVRNVVVELPVIKTDKRYFSLKSRCSCELWGIISDIKVEDGITIITLRSMLQVFNHFNVPIEVYYMMAKGNELHLLTAIEPGNNYSVPLNAVYTPTNELFFGVEGYSVSSSPFIWKDLQNTITFTKNLQCLPKNGNSNKKPFIIRAVGEMEQVFFENTSIHTMISFSYNIHLRPATTLLNSLPIDVTCMIENLPEEFCIKPGNSLILPNIEPNTTCIILRLDNYLDKIWSCRQEIINNPPEFSVWSFTSHDSEMKMVLDFGMHIGNKNNAMMMTLYCPFWMINKTELLLSYRKSKKAERHDSSGSPKKSGEDSLNILHHPPSFKGPVLFSFNAKSFFGKKKASVRVEQGIWSDKFSLDVAGSAGLVVCVSDGRYYEIGVHNQLTYNGLTKQITFTPYVIIINNAPFAIQCQESDRPADPWLTIEPNSCSPLWPKSEIDNKYLHVRIKDTEEISSSFFYTESDTIVLKLKNKYGGLSVDIQTTEGGIYINFAPYDPKLTPAIIINHTKDTMNFWEKRSVQIKKLCSNHHMYYTWDNLTGSRILAWEIYNKKEMYTDLRRDDFGEYSISENYHIYWISFLDGMQRVLLFTHNESVAKDAQAARLFEVIQQEITVSIHGIGLSLVNNLERKEIMYMGIACSGIIWEYCKINGKRFKHFSNKESNHLETAYQKFLLDKEAINDRILVDNKLEVDFKTGLMFKPNKRRIRRSFQTGMWLQMKTSPSQLQIHAKINRLQIDNQIYDCIFPVVLAPVLPPKTVVAQSGIKPFAEMSIVQLRVVNSPIKQYKYFKILIQEFHLKIDLGFLNALIETVQSSEYSEQEMRELFLNSLKLADEPLYSHVSGKSLEEQKSFYDLLHFSPLKIHVSFSMASGSNITNHPETPNVLKNLLQGLGVTLTDLQDVVFKLAYFERNYTFLTKKQLISNVITHYTGQSLKQLYVLVLGLDVLGNPYGFVLGITKGVEDLFYEPFQGAIQGPGEFAEGLVLGVRSLFGHTVGGAAGAFSRITGAMGKGIAALTFDEDFQRKRRDQVNKKPATVQEGIARSSKGLVMGVVDGVTGVFTKPFNGAKEEGFGGFFKGLGKGAVGLVARPTAGVVDFASESLDAVKRAAEIGEDVGRLRPPRFLPADGLVRPYNYHESIGHKFLIELEKGKYATTDIYVTHYNVIEKKEILLLTDKRLAYITHNDIFGGWQVDWSYTWQDIKHPPTVVPKGVSIVISDRKKRGVLFNSNGSSKILLIGNPEKKEEICKKIESLRGSFV